MTYLVITTRLQPVHELHEGVVKVLHGVCIVPHGGELVLRPGDGGAEARELCVVREKTLEVGETKGPKEAVSVGPRPPDVRKFGRKVSDLVQVDLVGAELAFER